MPSFGVYIHFPYCVSKCPYCDFASRVEAKIPHAAYGEAIRAELRAAAPLFGPRTVETVFFGGGTPSLWEPREVGATLDALAGLFPFAPDAEISLEANPGTVDVHSLRALRSAGIRRLSIGIQSLNDATLAELGRAHDAAAGRRAIAAAREAGFDNLSIDLIFGIENQSLDAWEVDLREALAFETEHISLYALTAEPATPLGERVARGKTVLPPDDDVAAMLERTGERTAARGFERYEVSNYARAGRRCRHNLLYWQGGEWLSAGVGAHGHRAVRGDALGARWWNTRGSDAYLRAAARGFATLDPAGPLPPPWAAGGESIDAPTALQERLFTGLRTADGVDLAALSAEYGDAAVAPVRVALAPFVERGVLVRDPARAETLRQTSRGLDVADGMAANAMAAVAT